MNDEKMVLLNDPELLTPDDQTFFYLSFEEMLDRIKQEDELEYIYFKLLDDFAEAYTAFKELASVSGDSLREEPSVVLNPFNDSGEFIFIFKCENNGNTYRIGRAAARECNI